MLGQLLTSPPKNVSNSLGMKTLSFLVWDLLAGMRKNASLQYSTLHWREKRVNGEDPKVVSSGQNVFPFGRREKIILISQLCICVCVCTHTHTCVCMYNRSILLFTRLQHSFLDILQPRQGLAGKQPEEILTALSTATGPGSHQWEPQ